MNDVQTGFGAQMAYSPHRKKYLAQVVFNEQLHFKERDEFFESLRRAAHEKGESLRYQVGENRKVHGSLARENQRAAVTVKGWDTELDADFSRLKTELQAVVTKKIPAVQSERIAEALTGPMASFQWRKIKPVDFFAGDARSSSEKRKDAVAARKIADANVEKTMKAPVHSDDQKARSDADLDQLAAKGAPDLTDLRASYAVSRWSGEFVDKIDARIAWPNAMAFSTDNEVQTPVHDTLPLLIWSDLPGWKARIYALIDEQADDENAIRLADRKKLLAEAQADLLLAQRREEAANRLCEAEGQLIFRPSEWPVSVMLQIERDPTPPKPKAEAPVKATADSEMFEGE
jgi:hypothetical protein